MIRKAETCSHSICLRSIKCPRQHCSPLRLQSIMLSRGTLSVVPDGCIEFPPAIWKFWAVNCANEQLWSRAEIVPMFCNNSSVKWTILSSHHVHKRRSSQGSNLLTQPKNLLTPQVQTDISHDWFLPWAEFLFQIDQVSLQSRFSVINKMRGVFT